jgi:hypothetical protein
MKKILLGSATLCLFGIAVTIAQMSCQKVTAQQERPSSPASTGKILFSKNVVYRNVPPVTHTIIDSAGNTVVITDRQGFSINQSEYYMCNLDGSNVQLIPVSLPADLYRVGYAHFANGESSIVFQVQSDVTYNADGSTTPLNTAGQGIYSCNIDGSNLTFAVPLPSNSNYTILNDGN